MARGRFISNSMNENHRVESLPLACVDFYKRIIVFADAEGRLNGDAKYLKSALYPIRAMSSREIEQWLNMLWTSKDEDTGIGLIEWYEVNGKKYIWLPNFKKHQAGLRTETETQPEPDKEDLVSFYENATGRRFGPLNYDRLRDWLTEYGEEMIKKAIQEAVDFGAKSPMRYIETILESWKTKGVPDDRKRKGRTSTHVGKSTTDQELKDGLTSPLD